VTGRPVITATPENEDFFGKYEASGRIGTALVNRYFKAVAELVERVFQEAAVHRALEIGCGPGYSTQRIRAMLPGHVELEASEYVAALAAFARTVNPGIRIEREDVYELQRPDDSYDLVFLLEVLEHLDYPDLGLAEVGRILRPGGLLVLGVPREPVWRVLNMARGKYWGALGNTPGHLNHWSSRSIKRYVGRQVAEVVETRTPLPWTLLLARAKR
jgi:SAM-dependent methyltransferase